jgi:hypothetical protein
LLNYIESVAEFEEIFLNNPVNLDNQNFINDEENNGLPRIIKSALKFNLNGILRSKRYLRTENGLFGEGDIPFSWARIYVEHKRNNKVLLFQQSQFNRKNLTGNVLVSKKIKTPTIIMRALVEINHGIPATKKYFIKDAVDELNIGQKRYLLFDNFNLGNQEVRRNNLARIFTGNESFEGNDQISLYSEAETKISLEYMKCKEFSSANDMVLFWEEPKELLAVCTNYLEIFVVSEKRGTMIIDDKEYSIKKLDKKGNTINQIFSSIINGEIEEYELIDYNRKVVFNTANKEKITIVKLN